MEAGLMRTLPALAILPAVVLAAALTAACAPAAPADTTLDCSAPDIHHVLRLSADGRHADDITSAVAKAGTLSLSGGEYVVRFVERRDSYETMFRIDKATFTGTRALYDDEQQPIRGHGGFDQITCRPASGR
jgi:hypothetical protein